MEPCNEPANHQNGQDAPYIWNSEETFLLIRSYEREGIHRLVKKQEISAALQRCVQKFNTILFEKKGRTICPKKCYSKIDTLKRVYREKLDLKNKSGGQPITWPYLEVLHDLFHKESWVEPLSVAGSGLPAIPDVEILSDVSPRTKKAKPLQLLLEEMSVERDFQHRETMSRLDRFNDCMESMAQSFSIIAATKKAKLDHDYL